MQTAADSKVVHAKDRADALAGRLDALGPLRVLDRGYSVTLSDKGRVVRGIKDVKAGDRIETRLADGRVVSRVEQTDALAKDEREG